MTIHWRTDCKCCDNLYRFSIWHVFLFPVWLMMINSEAQYFAKRRNLFSVLIQSFNKWSGYSQPEINDVEFSCLERFFRASSRNTQNSADFIHPRMADPVCHAIWYWFPHFRSLWSISDLSSTGTFIARFVNFLRGDCPCSHALSTHKHYPFPSRRHVCFPHMTMIHRNGRDLPGSLLTGTCKWPQNLHLVPF